MDVGPTIRTPPTDASPDSAAATNRALLDPFLIYAVWTPTPVPEPASLSLLGIGSAWRV